MNIEEGNNTPMKGECQLPKIWRETTLGTFSRWLLKCVQEQSKMKKMWKRWKLDSWPIFPQTWLGESWQRNETNHRSLWINSGHSHRMPVIHVQILVIWNDQMTWWCSDAHYLQRTTNKLQIPRRSSSSWNCSRISAEKTGSCVKSTQLGRQ